MPTSCPCLLRHLPDVQSLSSAPHPALATGTAWSGSLLECHKLKQISSCFHLLYMLNITVFSIFFFFCLQKLWCSSWNALLSSIVWIFCFHGKDFDLSNFSSRKAWSTFPKCCGATRAALNVAVSLRPSVRQELSQTTPWIFCNCILKHLEFHFLCKMLLWTLSMPRGTV